MMGIHAAQRLIQRWACAFVDPRRALGIAHLPRFLGAWLRYRRLAERGTLRWSESFPCLSDCVAHTPLDPHYFYQAAWASRRIVEAAPLWHVEVGSSVALISVVSAYVPTVFVDYRPLKANVPGLTCMAGDILALPFASGSVSSLSCLHVIEHIGLGRYGDPLDPQGSIKGAAELMRILGPDGRLLLSAPVGRERVQFNAHRIFAPRTVTSMFRELDLVDFSFVDDAHRFWRHAALDDAAAAEYACGMFEFRKRGPASAEQAGPGIR